MAVRFQIHGRVFVVRSFVDEADPGNNIWLLAGRTTPWSDEANPPAPEGDETTVEEPQFAKRVEVSYAVYPGSDTDYDIRIESTYWKIAADESASYSNNARYLYLKFVVDKGDGPDVDVRQFGIMLGLTAPGAADPILPLNAEITDYGRLLYLDNRRKIDREPTDQGEIFEYIIAF